MPAHSEASSPLSSPTSLPSPYRTNTHRILKAQASDSYSRIGRPFGAYGVRSPPPNPLARYFDDQPVRETYDEPPPALQAFLTTDLVIAWSTEALRGFLGFQELNCVKSLFDIVSTQEDRERLYRLTRQIQDEVTIKDPTYLSPPATVLHAIVKGAPLADTLNSATNHMSLEETLDLRLPNGQRYRTGIRIRLLQTRPNWNSRSWEDSESSMFFVVAEFTSVVEVLAPPHLTAVSPGQYGPPPHQYGSGPSQVSMPPLASPLLPSPHQAYGGEPPAPPLSPYSLHPIRGLPSPVDSRPRSLSTYPSLAQYANSSPSAVTSSQSFGRIPMSSHSPHLGLSFRRHSEQLPPSSLKLPPIQPLRSSLSVSMETPHQETFQSSLGEQVRKTKRIAVEDVLQSNP